MDKEQKSKAEYNRTQMEEHIRRICHMARGTDASILPYINKADGTFSPKKAHDFIKDILCGADNLGTKEKGFLTAFFYCTFRCFASSRIRDYYAYEEFRPCATFQDILVPSEYEITVPCSSKRNILIFLCLNKSMVCAASSEV